MAQDFRIVALFSRRILPPGAMAYVQQPDGTFVAPAMFQQPDGTWVTQPMAPMMPAPMPSVDYSQGKWFAPGEALPPGFVAVAHPEGLTQPLDTHAMSDLVKSSGSFVVTGMAPAAAADTTAVADAIATKALPASTAAKKSKKSKKKK